MADLDEHGRWFMDVVKIDLEGSSQSVLPGNDKMFTMKP